MCNKDTLQYSGTEITYSYKCGQSKCVLILLKILYVIRCYPYHKSLGLVKGFERSL